MRYYPPRALPAFISDVLDALSRRQALMLCNIHHVYFRFAPPVHVTVSDVLDMCTFLSSPGIRN